jgi:hypothetical protein
MNQQRLISLAMLNFHICSNSRPGKINGKNLMYNVIHFLLRASAQLNPLSLGIGTMLDGGASKQNKPN